MDPTKSSIKPLSIEDIQLETIEEFPGKVEHRVYPDLVSNPLQELFAFPGLSAWAENIHGIVNLISSYISDGTLDRYLNYYDEEDPDDGYRAARAEHEDKQRLLGALGRLTGEGGDGSDLALLDMELAEMVQGVDSMAAQVLEAGESFSRSAGFVSSASGGMPVAANITAESAEAVSLLAAVDALAEHSREAFLRVESRIEGLQIDLSAVDRELEAEHDRGQADMFGFAAQGEQLKEFASRCPVPYDFTEIKSAVQSIINHVADQATSRG